MDFSVIDNLSLELRSDKITLRTKAFNKFYDLLCTRHSEIQNLAQRDKDFSWEEIFKSAHIGIVAQARKLLSTSTEQLEKNPKTANFERTILKICDSPQNGEEFKIRLTC